VVDIERVDIEYCEPESVDAFLRELGANDRIIDRVKRRVQDVDVQEAVRRFRAFARENPAVIIGALSAVILGGGALAARSTKKRTTTRKRRASTGSKRTLIEPHAGDKRYVRRDSKGRIRESVDVGKSLSADRRRHSKKRAARGRGDKGDR
jgi:hypothetical protein